MMALIIILAQVLLLLCVLGLFWFLVTKIPGLPPWVPVVAVLVIAIIVLFWFISGHSLAVR